MKLERISHIIFVTGTSGRKITMKMIKEVLHASGFLVESGEVKTMQDMSKIIKQILLKNIFPKDVLLLSVEETLLPQLLIWIKPHYLIVTNIYRYPSCNKGNIEWRCQKLQQVVTQETQLLLNADDPFSSWLGKQRGNTTYFGIARLKNKLSNDINQYCPCCMHVLRYHYYHFVPLGDFYCEQCGYTRKKPDYQIADINLHTGECHINERHSIKLPIDGVPFLYPVIATYTMTKILGIEDAIIVRGINQAIVKDDTIQKITVNQEQTIWVIKEIHHPITFEQTIQWMNEDKKDCIVVIHFNGTENEDELAWLWEMDFSLLNSPFIHQIILSGEKVEEMYTRIKTVEGLVEKTSLQSEIGTLTAKNIFVLTDGKEWQLCM